MSDKIETVVSVQNVGKHFKLPHQKVESVKNIFTNIFSIGNNSFETQHALKDISFEIKKGEFFGIVGRNGSGKSTLLKILAGIYQPNIGKVSVKGRLVPFIELGVGFNGELTGRENVYLNGALLGFSKKEIDAKYQAIVEFAEIERFMDQKLKNYSSGMQVRLAFSVATVLAESDILLIDEVLAVGDADFQRKCFRYFKKLKKTNKTVVFVTHDMNAIREYCDKAILIEKQKIIASGTPELIAKKYEKLLQPKNSEKNQENSGKKWGDGTLTISSPEVMSIDDDFIRVGCRLTANKDCSDPELGLAILSASKQVLFGTNTKIENIKIPKLNSSQVAEVIWTIPNILSDGEYSITMAAQYEGGGTVASWWEEAVIFNIVKDKRSPYSIQPSITASIDVHK
jgi:ABC-2 type transport system ATP-binding protein